MKINKKYFKLHRRQGGQAMMIVLILLGLGSLVITPILSMVTNSFTNGRVYEQKTDENYAAKSGLEDATWQIKNNKLATLLTNPVYDEYNFSTTWSYTLAQPVNTMNTTVSLQNVWLPRNISVPNPATAKTVIQSGKLVATGDTIQTGITAQDGSKISLYRAKFTYFPATGETLTVDSLGVWLPRGYDFYTDATHKSNLETTPISGHAVTYATAAWAGNKAATWTYASPPNFTQLPVSGTLPITAELTFYFKPLDQTQPAAEPYAVAWIKTANGAGYGIPYSWNADIKVYKVRSVVGSTTVESYFAVSALRQLQEAISGDYYATGNSNLSAASGSYSRTVWHDPSTAAVTADNIPADADVAYAFLYWSGWKNDSSTTTIKSDPCSNFTYWPWSAGSRWTVNGSKFRGQGVSGGTTSDRTLTSNSDVNLSSYTGGTITVSMSTSTSGNLESSDILYYALYSQALGWSSNIEMFHGNNSPSTFSFDVPDNYVTANFRIRFYQTLNSTNEYVYLDDITVTAQTPDNGVVFKINDGTGYKQVYFDASGNPKTGTQELTAARSQMLQNYSGSSPHGYSYSCFRDVTALVRKYSKAPVTPATNWTGYATYSVGGIDASASPSDEWAYANWSIIIIYTSAETQGHQLYLFDNLIYSNQDTDHGVNVDFDGDGQPGGTISGFIVPSPVPNEINAAKLTVFAGEGDVWYSGDYIAVNGTKLWDGTNTTDNSKSRPNNDFNSTSLGISTYDGIDIDTMGIDPPNGKYITWDSHILNTGDTSAHIDMWTHTDVWNLVYIIISFRSQTTVGGILSYRIIN